MPLAPYSLRTFLTALGLSGVAAGAHLLQQWRLNNMGNGAALDGRGAQPSGTAVGLRAPDTRTNLQWSVVAL